jgi:N-methylhydantoinase A
VVLGGSVALDRDRVRRSFAEFGASLGLSDVDAAAGVVAVADAEMTRALRRVSIERGLDPRQFTLVAYGGAGPLHALALAEALGITRAAIPRACGVLSALGLAVCDLRRDYVRALHQLLDDLPPGQLESAFSDLESRALADLPGGRIIRNADVRYVGQSFELTVDAGNPQLLADRFHEVHEQRYGFRLTGEPIELISVRVTVVTDRGSPEISLADDSKDVPPERRLAYIDGTWAEIEAFDRLSLKTGILVEGPAIVEFPEATCFVRPDWTGEVDDAGTLVLQFGGSDASPGTG